MIVTSEREEEACWLAAGTLRGTTLGERGGEFHPTTEDPNFTTCKAIFPIKDELRLKDHAVDPAFWRIWSIYFSGDMDFMRRFHGAKLTSKLLGTR